MALYLEQQKDENILQLTKEFNLYLNNIKDIINLPKKWRKEEALIIEIKKSFIRGLLRYSACSLKLVDAIKTNFIKQFPDKKNIEWISLPYPMIHLPNDNTEDGGFHNDGDKKDFFTCWVPITNYDYQALSIFKFQNKLIDRISSLIIKSGIPNIFSKKLNASQGNIFFWNAQRIHKGNLNISNNISVAIQLKLTSQIYEFEQSRNFISKQKNDFNDQFNNLDNSKILKSFESYNSCLSFLIENVSKYDELSLVNKLSEKIKKKSMSISFALSVLAQRIFSKKKYFQLTI